LTALLKNMSLRAKIEAVLYAAEEPVTLAQLAAVFAPELNEQASASLEPPSASLNLPPADSSQDEPSIESLIEQGFVQAEQYSSPNSYLAEAALLTPLAEETQPAPPTDIASTETKSAGRSDRQVRAQLKTIVDDLIQEYANADRGMEIREVAGGYRVATKAEYHDAVRAFAKSLKPPMKLSLQALETLAVIAYKQPVTAPEVTEIRGVDASGVLGSLMSRKLITTAGRKQVIGRPILYKTTREFLLRFGLKDLNELPSIEEFEKLAGDIEIGEDEPISEETSLPFEDAATATEEGAPSFTTDLSSASVELSDPPVDETPSHPVTSEEVHG
jgi:segregation and condensation protein B